MSTLDSFLERGWDDHALHAAAVAERLPEGLRLVQDDDGAMRFAGLAHHVLGEHLQHWQEGLALFAALAEQRPLSTDARASITRCRASLALSGGMADEREGMTASDRCRVSAMAAANLAVSDTRRAWGLLDEAVLGGGALADGDPAVRTLAANGNNIAATLRDLAPLEPDRRELMIHAAQVARTYWQRAGTWLEVERAEYRLAVCWLAAGDPAEALAHARHCDFVVRANGSVPLEKFFASEAMCLAARAAGDDEAARAALSNARQAFDAIAPTDQAWCRGTLEKLDASPAVAR
jgi:hypothetical protein